MGKKEFRKEGSEESRLTLVKKWGRKDIERLRGGHLVKRNL